MRQESVSAAVVAALISLLASGPASGQADPFGALYTPPPGSPAAKETSSGRTGATSVSGAVGRSYAGSQTSGAVSLAQLDMMPGDLPPMPIALKSGSTRYLANRPKIAVPAYTIGYIQGASASAFGGGAGSDMVGRRTKIATRLVGLSDQMAQDLADEAHADLLRQLQAAGFTIVDLPALQASPGLRSIARYGEPVGGQGIIDGRATKAWVAYGPRALPPIKGYAFEQGLTAVAASGALMAFGKASQELDAILLNPRLMIDYIDMQSTGQRTYSGSGSVDASLRFAVNTATRADFVWGNERGGPHVGWFAATGFSSPQPFGILAQADDRSDSVALHNALAGVGFGSVYRQSLVYDAEVSPKRFAALTRAAFRGYNAALVAEIRKARGV